MNNVILVDFPEDNSWEFVKAINGYAPFYVEGIPTSSKFYHTKFGTLIRYLLYFMYPLHFVLFKRKKYNRVLAWQQFYGINFAFWCRALHLRKCNYLAVDTFIFKKRGGYLGRLYYNYVRWSINNKYVDKIICYSSTEPKFYSEMFCMPSDKFCFVPLGIDTIKYVDSVKGNYIFSTGRSNRDYDFLVDSMKGSDFNIKIASSEYTFNSKSMNPKVEILSNCYGNDMLKQLAHSFCVVIPLKDTHVSSGQIVILQSMQLGKPVIVTENDTVEDYINNGENGFIIGKDKMELSAVLNRLRNDETLYDAISKNAKSSYESHFSLHSLAKNVWKMIKDK